MIPEKSFANLEYAVSSKYLTTIHKGRVDSLITHKYNFGKVQWLKKTQNILLNYYNIFSYSIARLEKTINLKATKRV